MEKKEILKIVEDAFNEHISAEGWLDHGTPMATLTGKEAFLNEVLEKLKEAGKASLPFDYTFPTRLKSFAEDVSAGCAAAWEEKEYLVHCAKKLIEHQIETATNQHEIDYLNRLHKK